MQTIFMCGFESGQEGETNANTAAVAIKTTHIRSGTYALEVGNNQWLGHTIPGAMTEFVIGFGLYWGSLWNNKAFFALQNGSDNILTIKINASNQLEVYSGWLSSKYFTGSTVMSASTGYYVELYFKLDDTNGAIELRVDGNTEGVFTGDTKPGSDANFDRFIIGSSAPDYGFNIDDLMVNAISPDLAGSWPNGAKIVRLKPTADGSSKEWSPSSGSDHYAVVDEIPTSATDFLQAESVDLVDDFTLEDLPAEAKSIAAVSVQAWAFKSNTYSPDKLKLGLVIGGTNYFSSDKTLPLTQGVVNHLLNTNPATSVDFTVSNVNGMYAAIKSA